MVKGGDEKERDKQTLKHSRLQGERDRKKKRKCFWLSVLTVKDFHWDSTWRDGSSTC